MAITFPTSPVVNQTFSSNTRTWKWNGVAWDAVIQATGTTIIGGTGGLESIGVSGGTSISDPDTLTLESFSDILRIYAEEPTSNDALIRFGITGESGTTLEHDIASNHFYTVASQDRSGYGHRFLMLNDDGTVGFQYIQFQDVFKPSEFTFTIGSFTINGSSNNSALIGQNTNVFDLTDLSGPTDQFAVTYPSVTISTSSAQITGFSDGVARDLSSPYTTLSTSGLGVTYPSGTDQTVTFTVRATGDNGSSTTRTCTITFPNYTYWGESSTDIDGSNMSSLRSSVLRTGSQLDSGYQISVTTGIGEYVWFAYPKRHGLIESVVDTLSGQDKTDIFPLFSTVSHTNSNGYEEEYYIYRSSQVNQGSETLTFTTV